MGNSTALHLAAVGSGVAGRLRAPEFHRQVFLEKKHCWQMLACTTFSLAPEIAGLQMCARFCLVYHSYCCGENFVLPLNLLSPTHRHDHAAHRQGLAEAAEAACSNPRAGTERHFREIDGSQRTAWGRETLAVTGDAASRAGGRKPLQRQGQISKGTCGRAGAKRFCCLSGRVSALTKSM